MNESFIDSQIQILEKNQLAWNQVMPAIQDDLSPYGLSGMTKTAVANMFPFVIRKLENLRSSHLEQSNPFLIQTIFQNFPSWTGLLEGWIASMPSNPSFVGNIVSHLNAMWSQLNTFELHSTIPDESEIGNLVEMIKGSQITANSLVKDIEEKRQNFEQMRKEAFDQCYEILDKATESLEAAARSGLGKSFSDRAGEYDRPRNWWLGAFIVALLAIVSITYCYILDDLKDEYGLERLYHFLTDLPLTLPFLWLAWFSALRFSQLGRFKEDYKFKVATALALDGYRKQAGEVNKELEQKLLDLAITNFGENPLRLMTKDSAKDAHPLAGIFDKQALSELLSAGIKATTEKVSK